MIKLLKSLLCRILFDQKNSPNDRCQSKESLPTAKSSVTFTFDFLLNLTLSPVPMAGSIYAKRLVVGSVKLWAFAKTTIPQKPFAERSNRYSASVYNICF